MSDTPRTDAACFAVVSNDPQSTVVWADFARDLERENAALRKQLADIKSVLFAVRADLEPADREPAVLMVGDGILAALLHAARAKEGKP